MWVLAKHAVQTTLDIKIQKDAVFTSMLGCSVSSSIQSQTGMADSVHVLLSGWQTSMLPAALYAIVSLIV
jgi:hypothetical protein